MTPLEELHNHGCEFGKMMLKKHNNVFSFFLVIFPDGQEGYIATPWKSSVEKPVYIAAIRQLFREKGIVAYTFVTEAWVATIDPRTQRDLMNVAPRDRSDRLDTLIVMSRHRDGEHYGTMHVVHYDAKGNVTLDPAEKFPGDDFSEGLMANLFEKWEGH